MVKAKYQKSQMFLSLFDMGLYWLVFLRMKQNMFAYNFAFELVL